MSPTTRNLMSLTRDYPISVPHSTAGKVMAALLITGTAILTRKIISSSWNRNTDLSGLHIPTEGIDCQKCRLRFATRTNASSVSKRTKYLSELDTEKEAFGSVADSLFFTMRAVGAIPSEEDTSDHNGVSNIDYERTAHLISEVMKSNLITGNDLLRSNMAKVFHIHRSLGAESIPTPLAIRFTIQYNLFAGTIANLGSNQQRALLDQILANGEIGSFVLTEVGAGVVSGLIVETVAVWQSNGTFKLHCPTPEAAKTWICNGLTAKWGIVVARLVLPETQANQSKKKRPSSMFSGYLDFGPHAFLVNLSALDTEGTLTRTSMGQRTSFNNLDVATLIFNHATIPIDSLLSSGLSNVDPENGNYSLADPSKPFKFEVVAQRLLAGRICISGVSLSFLKSTVSRVRAYDRQVPAGKGKTQRLVDFPAISNVLDEAEMVGEFLSAYIRIIETKYQTANAITSNLAEDIALAKMVCIEAAIYYSNKIKGAIGSWSLFSSSPFGSNIENLYAYKFAEGDTNILVQKVARDVSSRKGLSLGNIFAVLFSPNTAKSAYASSLLKLAWTMGVKTLGKSIDKKMKIWFSQHRLVKEVAWRHATEVIRQRVIKTYPEFQRSAELAFFDAFAEVLIKTQC